MIGGGPPSDQGAPRDDGGAPPDDGSAGWVFNVQRFSVHDGPGIRTTVFLKGCPLRCAWCCNPESQRAHPQVVFWEERCIGCGTCLAVCDREAISLDAEGRRWTSLERCDLCGRCLDECFSGALERIGRLASVEEILAEVEEDRPFYESSGGGVTLSGGEPLAQPAFAGRLLRAFRERRIHTAVETCGYAPWEEWEGLLSYADLVLFDLKHMDPVRHEQLTGLSNALIIDNLRRLSRTAVEVIVRLPVVPGCNDDAPTLEALAELLLELGTVREVHLLPYHRFGRAKYQRLGLEHPLGDLPSAQPHELLGPRSILASYGLDVKLGG